MKSDAFARLWLLYKNFDPRFEAAFKVEFPRLSESEQLRFVDMMTAEVNRVIATLRPAEAAIAAH